MKTFFLLLFNAFFFFLSFVASTSDLLSGYINIACEDWNQLVFIDIILTINHLLISSKNTILTSKWTPSPFD